MAREKKIRIGWGNHPDNFVTESEARQIATEARDDQIVSVAREAAKQPMGDGARGKMITELCARLDNIRHSERPALYEGLDTIVEGLTCLHGTCDHYTCTEGQALAEWEFNNRHLHG